MIFYKNNPEDDPYYNLWNSAEWLFPFDYLDRLVFPKIITLEPVNICQNNCIYCQMRLMDRKTGQIDLALVEKLAIEASRFGSAVRLGGYGEPLIHKQIVELVEILKKHNVQTTIFTNGNLLTEEMVKAFCDFGLDELVFSGSGVTPEIHNEIRKKSDYAHDFKEKIEMSYKIREEANKKWPYFRIYTNVFNYEDELYKKEVDNYVEYFLKYVDKIDIDLTNMNRVRELDEVKPYLESQVVDTTYKPCVTLYHKWLVHWNGDIFMCDIPYDKTEEYLIGNILDDNIEDLYFNEKVELMREKTSRLEHAELPLCNKCFSNTNKYEALKEKFKVEVTP